MLNRKTFAIDYLPSTTGVKFAILGVPFASTACQRHDILLTPHQRNKVERSVGNSGRSQD
jgi:hypothetical protein